MKLQLFKQSLATSAQVILALWICLMHVQCSEQPLLEPTYQISNLEIPEAAYRLNPSEKPLTADSQADFNCRPRLLDYCKNKHFNNGGQIVREVWMYDDCMMLARFRKMLMDETQIQSEGRDYKWCDTVVSQYSVH